MSFKASYADYKREFPFISEFADGTVKKLKNSRAVVIEYDSVMSGAARHVFDNYGQTMKEIMSLLVFGKLLKYGPKVFHLSELEIKLLMEVDLNIPMCDYVQPYNTMVFQLPQNFHSIQINGEQEHLDYIVFHHEPEECICIIYIRTTHGHALQTSFSQWPDHIIEDRFKEMTTAPEIENEQQFLHGLMRACMNYCLLLEEVGTKRVESSNPKYEKKLIKRAEAGDIKAKEELQSRPEYFEIAQKVVLARSVNTSESNNSTGRSVKPHHRRGYYRIQHYGKGLAEKKRIRIPPVFVNATKFSGELMNTYIEYTKE